MSLALEQPMWLWALAALAPGAVAACVAFRGVSSPRRVGIGVLRVGVLVLLACALAGLSSVREVDRVAVIGVVDVSGSVRTLAPRVPVASGERIDPIEAARRFLQLAGRERRPGDVLGVVAFDGRSTAVVAPTSAGLGDFSLDVRTDDGSDIESAIRSAAALLPPDARGRLVVFSDGVQTSGDALAGAREVAASRGARIDVVPFSYELDRETVVEFLDVPPTAREGEALTARVGLRSTQGASGVLRITEAGQVMDLNGADPGQDLRLDVPRGESVAAVEIRPLGGRVHSLEAVFLPEAGDTVRANNRAEAVTISTGGGAVLLIDGVEGSTGRGADALASVVREAGFDVTVTTPEAAPRSILELQAYDLVGLLSVASGALPGGESYHPLLVSAVEDFGVGLVMIGGPDSFAPGGWRGTPLEPILPVYLDIPDQVVSAEVAVVLVLDGSGSMSRGVLGSIRSQQEIANEAAAQAIRTLDSRDLVGVVRFSSSASTVVELGPNTDPSGTAARIRAISSGGGTDMAAGLERAREMLNGADARAKHIVLLSDGRSRRRDDLAGLATQLRAEGVRLSTIAVGGDADIQVMGQMAAIGEGQFHEVMNPNLLPRVLIKAVRLVRSPLIHEGPTPVTVLSTGSPITVDLPGVPDLGGLVITRPRSEPTITLAMVSNEGRPVLAHWRQGLGQVAAFTSDAHQWTSPWIPGGHYRQLWTSLARSVSRSDRSGGGVLTVRVREGRLSARLEMRDTQGRPVDGLAVPITFYSLAGAGSPLDGEMTQVGPGDYELIAPWPDSAGVVAIAKPRFPADAASSRLPPVVSGAGGRSTGELRALASDDLLVRDLARAGGGRVLALVGQSDEALGLDLRTGVFDRDGSDPPRAMSTLWWPLVAWGLALALLDIANRRIAWDRLLEPARRPAASSSPASAGAGAGGAKERIAALRRSPKESVLTEADARRVAAEEAARQRIERLERFRREVSARSQTRSVAPDPTANPSDEAPGDPPPGLLAAKRRAAKRIEEAEDRQ